jgi:competence protein ComEC
MLLQALRPGLTVASAGENNRYGHPSQDAIVRIRDHGSAFYSTIDCGRIRVKIVDGKIQADAYIPSVEKTFIY